MLQDLCLLLSLSVQVVPPKPAGFLPEAQKWILDHAGDWDHGNFLSERLRTPKTVVLVAPAQAGASTLALPRCFEKLRARNEPLCRRLATGWGHGRALHA